jgi:hypothetical protein
MRTLAAIGVVILLEVAALAIGLGWRRRAQRHGARAVNGHQISAVLEIEDADAPLPSAARTLPARPLPVRILAELAADPMLGLAEVRIVRHLQPTGAGLPERSQVAASYQGWNDRVAKLLARVPGEPPTGPVPALRLTWVELRLALPGSRDAAAAERAAGPIAARGGGRIGAARTLDKAARTAIAMLNTAGFEAVRLAERDLAVGLAVSTAVSVTSAGRVSGVHIAGDETPTPDRDSTAALPLALPITPSGLLIGLDPAHVPVVLGLFRRRPLTVAVIGDLQLAQILVLRAAALGARVVVETARGDEWDPLLLGSGLDASRFVVQSVGQATGHAFGHSPAAATPTPTAPLLVLRDCGARPPYTATPHGPWTTVLTLLPYLDPRAAGQLAAADLVGLQRVTGAEAGIVRQVLGLPERDAAALPDLPGQMAVWQVRGRRGRYCEITPTPWEAALVGAPVSAPPPVSRPAPLSAPPPVSRPAPEPTR